MKLFLSEDFLLHTETATVLYHDFAENMPIFDYHCHLSVNFRRVLCNLLGNDTLWLSQFMSTFVIFEFLAG